MTLPDHCYCKHRHSASIVVMLYYVTLCSLPGSVCIDYITVIVDWKFELQVFISSLYQIALPGD